MRGVHTNLAVPPPLQVEELILTLGTNRLFLVLPRSYHGWMLISLKLKQFPQIAPIVRAWFWFLSPNDELVKAQRAIHNEFVESGLKN